MLLVGGCAVSQYSTSEALFTSVETDEPPIQLLAHGCKPPPSTVRLTAAPRARPKIREDAGSVDETPTPTPAELASAGMPAFEWLMTRGGGATDGGDDMPFFQLSKGYPVAGLSKSDHFHAEIGEEADDEISANRISEDTGRNLARRGAHGLTIAAADIETSCLNPELVTILKAAQRNFGKPVVIHSGFRDVHRNRRAGGARNSMHLYCMAADVQVEGVSKWDLAHFLSQQPGRGGVGTYCRTRSVHIDVGPRREWHHPCTELAAKTK